MADRPGRTVDPVIAEARERWRRCEEHEDAQRKAILEAKQFRAGDQWPQAVKLQRQGAPAIVGQLQQPPRPCLTIDRLSPPIRQLTNQIRAAQFAIDVVPNGGGADDDTAECFKGALRRVQVLARDQMPVEWAAEAAIEGGLGWFRIRTEYVHERWDGDPSDPAAYDQELRLERIPNNLSVYCDPLAYLPTRSDAVFMFVTQDLSKSELARRYPQADLNSLDEFAATGDMPSWCEEDVVRIAEYWRITYRDAEISDGTATRRMRVPTVEGFKMTATQVLERWDWLGSRIPLIPILGEELNINGKTVLRGIIQEGMDAQRMVNYTYSGAVEIFALGSKSPYIVGEEQLGAYQNIWQTANQYNYSFLPFVNVPGLPPPHRDTSEAPIQAAVALMLRSEEAIKATTSVYDPSLEYNNPREHSGEAIKALQQQSDMASSGYGLSVARALVYAGQLMVEILPKLTRPGQLLQILGVDDKAESVLLGQAFQRHPKTGAPMPVPGLTPEMAQFQQGVHEFYDLSKGRYAVTVVVGKSTATRREEGASALAQLIPHLPPEMAAVATPEYVEQLSFTGSHKIAEMLRKSLPAPLQAQLDGQPQIPPAVQAQMAAMQQQMQQLAELADKNKTELMKAQMAAQARLAEAAQEIASREKIAMIQATTTLTTTQAKLDAEDARTFVDAMESRIGRLLDLHMQKLGQVHEAQQQQHAQAHEHAAALELAQLGHQQALALGAQQAAQSADATGEP